MNLRPNQRVLIVDDDAAVRRLMALIVTQEGYETLEAQNGVEALEVIETTPVDLLLTDVDMPGMSGLELIRIVRERGLAPHSMAVTGGGGDSNDYDDFGCGPIPLLRKPFTSEQLAQSIRTLLCV